MKSTTHSSEIGTPGFEHADRRDAQRLWNPRRADPTSARAFTGIFNRRRELIDHILVSHALVTRVRSVDTSSTDLPSIGEVPERPAHRAPSDHAAVLARFAIA